MKLSTALQAAACGLHICSATPTNRLATRTTAQVSQAAAAMEAVLPMCEGLNHIQCWDQYKQCHQGYFASTKENMIKSNVSEWYHEFVTDAALKEPGFFLVRGEAALFGKVALNDQEFQCSIYHQGCTGRQLNPKAVVEFVEASYPNNKTREILDLARKIHFAHLVMISTANDLYYSWVSNTTSFICVTDFG